MRMPTMTGLIERRILINYRVDPDVVRRLLPAPFEPLLIRGHAVAGICLIRLSGLRPRFLPRPVGLSSENAAHRFAVTFPAQGKRSEGVYISRRDSSSRINSTLGGRVFPGFHHHSRFQVREADDRWQIAVSSDGGEADILVEAQRAGSGQSQLFDSIESAADFFRRGAQGFSGAPASNILQGLELRCEAWDLLPLRARVQSTFFENRTLFPAGSLHFDSAYLMQNVPHSWRDLGQLGGISHMCPATS